MSTTLTRIIDNNTDYRHSHLSSKQERIAGGLVKTGLTSEVNPQSETNVCLRVMSRRHVTSVSIPFLGTGLVLVSGATQARASSEVAFFRLRAPQVCPKGMIRELHEGKLVRFDSNASLEV